VATEEAEKPSDHEPLSMLGVGHGTFRHEDLLERASVEASYAASTSLLTRPRPLTL
jgi:hypothetical protein